MITADENEQNKQNEQNEQNEQNAKFPLSKYQRSRIDRFERLWMIKCLKTENGEFIDFTKCRSHKDGKGPKSTQFDIYDSTITQIIYGNIVKKPNYIIELTNHELDEMKEKYGPQYKEDLVNFYNEIKEKDRRSITVKLCTEKGYTYNWKAYEDEENKDSVPLMDGKTNIVQTDNMMIGKMPASATKRKDGYVYYATNDDLINEKIGWAISLKERIKCARKSPQQDAFDKGYNTDLWKYHFALKTKNAVAVEHYIHQILGWTGFHVRGEHFNLRCLDSVKPSQKKITPAFKGMGKVVFDGNRIKRIKQIFMIVEKMLNKTPESKIKFIEDDELKREML